MVTWLFLPFAVRRKRKFKSLCTLDTHCNSGTTVSKEGEDISSSVSLIFSYIFSSFKRENRQGREEHTNQPGALDVGGHIRDNRKELFDSKDTWQFPRFCWIRIRCRCLSYHIWCSTSGKTITKRKKKNSKGDFLILLSSKWKNYNYYEFHLKISKLGNKTTYLIKELPILNNVYHKK